MSVIIEIRKFFAVSVLLTLISCADDEDNSYFALYKDKFVPTKEIGLSPISVDVWTSYDTISIGDTLNVKFVLSQIIKDSYLNRDIKITNLKMFVKLDQYNEVNHDSLFNFNTGLSLYKDLYKYWRTIAVSGKQYDVYDFNLTPKNNNFILDVRYIAIKPGKYFLRIEASEISADYYKLDTIINFKPYFKLPIYLNAVNSFKYDFITNQIQTEYSKKTYFLIYVKE